MGKCSGSVACRVDGQAVVYPAGPVAATLEAVFSAHTPRAKRGLVSYHPLVGSHRLNIELNGCEARIIGCLIEKQLTTPEQYPLSLNALVAACNQRSNREPVMALTESTAQQALDLLKKRHLVTDRSGFGSRVTKYAHRFCNTELARLQFSPQELAIVCVLLLRGPQTPGELRTRAHRLYPFEDVHEVEATLQRLGQHREGPFVVRLPREPGRRESRYSHLFGGEIPVADIGEADGAGRCVQAVDEDRLSRLEEQVTVLRDELEGLRRLVEQLRSAAPASTSKEGDGCVEA